MKTTSSSRQREDEGVKSDVQEWLWPMATHPETSSVWPPGPLPGSGAVLGDEDIHWLVGGALAVPLILCLSVALASGTFQSTITHL